MNNNYLRISLVGILLFGLSNLKGQIAKFEAAYIYNFTRFIEWPADYKTGDFVIGVLGNDEIVGELNTLAASKKVLSQPIVVKTYNSSGEIDKCHILFIPESKGNQIESTSSQLASKSTLIVTSTNGAINKGSAINFLIVGGKLQFEMRRANAESHGLKVNSSLESLASKKY